jgi:hypothetical protein
MTKGWEMAKQTIPGFQTGGGGMLRKLIGTVVVLALLVIVVKHPADAANWVKAAVGCLDGLVSFIRQVGNQP